jgi:hypothetical protein
LKLLKTLLFALFFFAVVFAQDKKLTYTQFEVTLAFTGNPKMEKLIRIRTKEPWLIPDGMGTKLGYGLRIKKMGWIRNS